MAYSPGVLAIELTQDVGGEFEADELGRVAGVGVVDGTLAAIGGGPHFVVGPVAAGIVVEVVIAGDDEIAAEEDAVGVANHELAQGFWLLGYAADNPLGGTAVEQQVRVAVQEGLEEVRVFDVAAEVGSDNAAWGDLFEQVFELRVLIAFGAEGLGIALIPTFLVADELRAGRLVALLEDSLIGEIGIHAVYPHRRLLSNKVRRLIDFLAEHCGERPYWDDGLDL